MTGLRGLAVPPGSEAEPRMRLRGVLAIPGLRRTGWTLNLPPTTARPLLSTHPRFSSQPTSTGIRHFSLSPSPILPRASTPPPAPQALPHGHARSLGVSDVHPVRGFWEGAHLSRHPRRRLSRCGPHSFLGSCRELFKKAQLGMMDLNCSEMCTNLSHWLLRSLCSICLPALRTQHAHRPRGLRWPTAPPSHTQAPTPA